MKRIVSSVASLVLAAGLAAGCARVPDRTDLAKACMKRMGGVQQKCDCYVASIEKTLPADQFTRLARGAFDNRDNAGADWLPNDVMAIPAISGALTSASATCLASA